MQNILIFSTLLATLCAPALTQTLDVEALDAELTRMAKDEGFAGTVLIARRNEVLLAKGYGLAQRENNVPFNPTTVSTIGSLTKQFTGAAILELQEEGRLKVSDTLAQHFDQVPDDKAKITLHQLLIHAAGLPGALGPDNEPINREAYLSKVWGTPLEFAPGTRHSYSNVGYSLLAAVVEAKSGQTYETYLRKAFFDPLGMKDTGYTRPKWQMERFAHGYRGDQTYGTVLARQQASSSAGFTWHLVGNGGIHSTIGDMFTWVRALRDGRVLSKASLEALFGEHIDEGGGQSFYGYGWVTFHLRSGGWMLGHNGGNDFFFADLNMLPDKDDLMYILLVNDPANEGATRVIARSLISSS